MAEQNTQVAPTENKEKPGLKESAKSVAESAKKIVTASKEPVKASHALLILLAVTIIAVGLTRAMTIKQVYTKAKDGRRQHFFGSEKVTYILDKDGDGFVEMPTSQRDGKDPLYIDGIMQK